MRTVKIICLCVIISTCTACPVVIGASTLIFINLKQNEKWDPNIQCVVPDNESVYDNSTDEESEKLNVQ